jgi:hypothetical protein
MSLIDVLSPWLGRRLEARRLPAAAARLGLHFRPGERRDQTGTLHGTLRDHAILVRPDKPSIQVRYASPIEGLTLLSTWCDPHLRRQPVDFESGVAAFDRRFRTRRASADVSTRLGRERAFFERAARFARRWRRSVGQLDFSGSEMAVWLKERGTAVSYINVTTLEAMMPDMLDLTVELRRSAAVTP